MRGEKRSDCPIAGSLDIIGDRWTLVVLRDILFDDRFSFAEIGALEGIATNVLSRRLSMLVECGLLIRIEHPTDRRRQTYYPTEASIALIPVLIDLVVWGEAYTEGRVPGGFGDAARHNRDLLIEQMTERIRKTIGENVG